MSARRRIVVVGAGSSGCVVAERLSRDERTDVVVVEEGPGVAGDRDLALAALPIGPWSTRVVHRTAADGSHLPRGWGLGGSSVVNGGYFMRGHREDFDRWQTQNWDAEVIARHYDTLDGGGSGGAMGVRRLDDDELHPSAHAFEKHWIDQGFGRVDDVWPGVGVNRVRSNSTRSTRMSAHRAYLHAANDRRNLTVRADHPVRYLLLDRGRVTGVVVGGAAGPLETIGADETILCAGTLASAALLARSTAVAATVAFGEHRELLVRYRPGTTSGPVTPNSALPLLPTVLHTDDRVEIRCYNGDFADHIAGLTPTGAAVGVALMSPRSTGTLVIGADGDQRVELGDAGAADRALMQSWAQQVVEMLDGPSFRGLVEPGSARIDASVSTSQHAWGSLPMGAATDWSGSVVGIDGLRVIDGSILPTPVSSGPHATVMMTAARIAELLATG